MEHLEAAAVDPANEQQARAWDGDDGAYWAAHADHFDRSLTGYHERFLTAAAIGPGEQVLDFGCGNGQTTLDAARRATGGRVVGVDLSSAMLDVARARAEAQGVTNVEFVRGDTQVYPFPAGAYDVAISRMGSMFFGDPVAAFRNVGLALKPGGRLVLLVWQALAANEWLREFRTALAAGRDLPAPPPEAPSPVALGDPERVRAVLGPAGYADVTVEGIETPMWYGADADEAYGFLSGLLGWMLEGVEEPARSGALDALRRSIAAHETPAGVTYGSAAWIVTARRP